MHEQYQLRFKTVILCILFSHKMRICLLHCSILISFTTGVFTMQECQRNYTQRCDSCTVAYTCQVPISEERQDTANDCRDSCDMNPLCLLAEYRPDNNCSRFLMTLDDHSSNIIRFCQHHTITGIVTPLSCIAKCFDTDDCQAVVQPASQNDCRLCTSEELFDIQVFSSSSAGTTHSTTSTPTQYIVRLIERHCVTDVWHTTTVSFIPRAQTESTTWTYSTTNNIPLSLLSSGFGNTTSHLFFSPSSTEPYPVTCSQITSSPSSSFITVPGSALPSQLNLPPPSSFFDNVRNIVIVSSIGGLLTITFFVVVLYYLLTRKFQHTHHL